MDRIDELMKHINDGLEDTSANELIGLVEERIQTRVLNAVGKIEKRRDELQERGGTADIFMATSLEYAIIIIKNSLEKDYLVCSPMEWHDEPK